MELEGQVYAMGSIKYAVVGISKELGLSDEESVKFFDAVVNGPEDDEIFKIVADKAKGFSEDQKLAVLSSIHDGWVVDNSSEKTFNKKVDRKQLRQYAPLELIGWNEVKSDLLFLNPIMSSIGVSVDENVLSKAYHEKVSNYFDQMNINNQNDLLNLISKGKNYYPSLNELDSRLVPVSDMVCVQIIDNWNVKDKETALIFANRNNAKVK